MGLIDFLEGAYQGGRLLFLLYDHDKQVKLRYKAMKGRGNKGLSSTTNNITRLREITPKNRPLVNEHKSQRKSPLDEEIELSKNLGYYVSVYNSPNTISPVEIIVSSKLFGGFFEKGCLYHPYTSTADKVKKIKRLRKKLRERIEEENSPKPYYELPKDGIMPHYGGISGVDWGAIGALASEACESLIKASKLRKHQQQLELKEYNFLTQKLNEKE